MKARLFYCCRSNVPQIQQLKTEGSRREEGYTPFPFILSQFYGSVIQAQHGLATPQPCISKLSAGLCSFLEVRRMSLLPDSFRLLTDLSSMSCRTEVPVFCWLFTRHHCQLQGPLCSLASFLHLQNQQWQIKSFSCYKSLQPPFWLHFPDFFFAFKGSHDYTGPLCSPRCNRHIWNSASWLVSLIPPAKSLLNITWKSIWLTRGWHHGDTA